MNKAKCVQLVSWHKAEWTYWYYNEEAKYKAVVYDNKIGGWRDRSVSEKSTVCFSHVSCLSSAAPVPTDRHLFLTSVGTASLCGVDISACETHILIKIIKSRLEERC